MRKILVLILTLTLLLCGCSDKITSGEVIEKNFTPAHTERRLVTTFVYTGKTAIPICVPYVFHYNDKWEIKIRKYSEEEQKFLYATYTLTEEAYNQIEIGNEFIYSKDLESALPEYTKERADD